MACTCHTVPAGDVSGDRKVRSTTGGKHREGVRGQHRRAVTRTKRLTRGRKKRSGTKRRRRPVHAYEWSKPPPYVGTWLSRSSPCVSARVGARGAGSYRRHQTRCWWCLESDVGRQRSDSTGKGSSNRSAQTNADGEGGRHRDATSVTGVGAARLFSRGCIGRDRSKRMRVTPHHLPVLRRANGGAHEELSHE
jgi:hypothetical protein